MRNAKMIYNGEIGLGFTKNMVIDAWGSPIDVLTIINTLGKLECWIYGLDVFVYFNKGKVVQIIN